MSHKFSRFDFTPDTFEGPKILERINVSTFDRIIIHMSNLLCFADANLRGPIAYEMDQLVSLTELS